MNKEMKNSVKADDALVRRFLKNSAKPIKDDGFTERVMEKIPARKMDWDSLLFIVCIAAAMIALMFTSGKDILVYLRHFHATGVELGAFFMAKSIYITLMCCLLSGVVYYWEYEN